MRDTAGRVRYLRFGQLSTSQIQLSATHYIPESAQHRTTPGRRVMSFTLALAIEILLLLAFFTLNWRSKEKAEFEGGRLTTFDISADQQQERTKAAKEQQTITVQKPPRPAPPSAVPVVKLPERPLQMIELTRAEYLASDISRLGQNSDSGRNGQLAEGKSPGDSERVGTAPNGQPLYAAEWYREPTNRELGAYLPKNMPESGGWGLIACRTAPRYRVEDCVELGNSPPGSHLAGAVRQAAWQFLVRPPRIGGKSMVGEWVRIRIDYTVGRERPEINP